MSKYSLSGYAIAVRCRTEKTLLLEGVSDKLVLDRLIAERISRGKDKMCLIDTADIIKSDIENNLISNKQKVIGAADFINFKNKFNWLADREWEGVDINCLSNINMDVVNKNLTKGHSIENYWFSFDAVVHFLNNHHCEKINREILNEIKNGFGKILIFALSISIAAKETNQIKKIENLINYNSVIFNNNFWFIRNEVDDALLEMNGVAISEKINTLKYREDILKINERDAQWIIHGHLGEKCIRACIANIFYRKNFSRADCESIENGNKKEKSRTDANFICSLPEDAISPISEIAAWSTS